MTARKKTRRRWLTPHEAWTLFEKYGAIPGDGKKEWIADSRNFVLFWVPPEPFSYVVAARRPTKPPKEAAR